MSKTTVVLDAGHGNGDPGAVYGENKEYLLAIKVVDELEKHYKRYGVKVFKVPHSENTFTSHRYKNLKGNYQVIEVHFDAFTNRNANGTTVVISDKFTANQADSFDKAVLKASSKFFRSRGIKPLPLRNADYCRINKVPYRLLEVCFITNKDDMRKLDTPAKISDYALNIVKETYKLLGGKEPKKYVKVPYAKVLNSNPIAYYTHAIEYDLTKNGTAFKDKNCTIPFKDSKGNQIKMKNILKNSNIITARHVGFIDKKKPAEVHTWNVHKTYLKIDGKYEDVYYAYNVEKKTL